MNQVELIPLQADDAKVRQLITKIKKSLKCLSISNSKTVHYPSREELFNSKNHVHYLELRKEGLAIEKLIKEAEEQDGLVDNVNTIPKYINPHYLDVRFSIFTCHSPLIVNIDHIQYDHSLKFGQIVAVHNDSKEIFLGMIANKLDEDVYRVFDMSDLFMFTICTSNQICPFPNALPKILSASSAFSSGDKVIAFNTNSVQDRNQFHIQEGQIICLVSNNDSKQQKYNVKFNDETTVMIEPQFLTKFESPFKCENEQAEELKQEYIENGIDPTIMLDPKEARKFKQANAKKLRNKKKTETVEPPKQEDKAAETDANSSSTTSNSVVDKKKDKKRLPTSMTTRSRSNPTPNTNADSNLSANTNNTQTSTTQLPSTPPPQPTVPQKEANRDIAGIPMKLPMTPDIHFVDPNSVPISIAAPPRVMQLQNMQYRHLQQNPYLYQQQMLLQQQKMAQLSQIQQQNQQPQAQQQNVQNEISDQKIETNTIEENEKQKAEAQIDNQNNLNESNPNPSNETNEKKENDLTVQSDISQISEEKSSNNQIDG